jgi:hypothetical protein
LRLAAFESVNAKASMTELHKISTGGTEPVGDVVFVHGLGGDPFTTWEFSANQCWSTWLAADRPDLAIWSLGYEVQPSAWSGTAMPLADRAVNVLATLDGESVGKRPLCFVTHSMGGLLVKQLLRHAWTISKEYRHICLSTKGVVFFSTPHTGSNLATLSSYLKFVIRTTIAVRELEAHDHNLRELNLWYRNNVSDLAIGTRVFFETRPTSGVMVVNATSADPGLPDVTPIPVDSDHFNICCPPSIKDLRYTQTLKFLNDRIRLSDDPVPVPLLDRFSLVRKRLLVAQSGRELRLLLHEVDELLAGSPHDPDGKQLREDIKTALSVEETPRVSAAADQAGSSPSREAPRESAYRWLTMLAIVGPAAIAFLLLASYFKWFWG